MFDTDACGYIQSLSILKLLVLRCQCQCQCHIWCLCRRFIDYYDCCLVDEFWFFVTCTNVVKINFLSNV
jgi:hypothetical protein